MKGAAVPDVVKRSCTPSRPRYHADLDRAAGTHRVDRRCALEAVGVLEPPWAIGEIGKVLGRKITEARTMAAQLTPWSWSDCTVERLAVA